VSSTEFELLTILIGTLGMLSGGLIGLKMFLNYRVRRLEASRGGDSPQVEEAVQALRDEVYVLRNELGEVQERLDFTERLLTRGSEPSDRVPGS